MTRSTTGVPATTGEALESGLVIDPTNPAVLDVHDFRRAGDMRHVHRVAPAPAGLGNPVITIEPGSDVRLDLLLESVIDGVLVTGTVAYDASGVCSRCLDPLQEARSTSLSELYLWSPPDEQDPDDDPLPVVAAGLIDLSDAVRDAIVLDVPLAPVCDDNCPGLCAECGARMADDPQHRHQVADPRWQALAAWQDPADDTATGSMRDT